ncbi:hypothetical protein ACH5RR_008139 [Cinchona calisaya]|uniref:Fe2OG dioxygenase domain-containing protein n=1 Tax=Cinchona calisaya TaxID=153742 RepID=A0ABD3ADF7_9GENT
MGYANEMQNKLPVIEFTKENSHPHSTSWISTRENVVRALEDYSCFIANYDKISLEIHEAIFRASKELFDLPVETKILNTSEYPGHGFLGQQPLIPLYESLGIENTTTPQGVQRFTNLMWPNGNDSFRESVLLYSKLVGKFDQIVMRMVSESYGIEKDYETIRESMTYLLKLIKYRGPKELEKKVGLSPHTDKSFITILHQHQVKGLEIKTKDGQWLVVDPSPSSFIVMAGDACMAWMNGRIEPAEHRVMMSGNEERYSLGVFTYIKDLIVQVPEELVDDEHPLQYKPFDHYKFLHFYFTEEARRSKCPIKAYCGL